MRYVAALLFSAGCTPLEVNFGAEEMAHDTGAVGSDPEGDAVDTGGSDVPESGGRGESGGEDSGGGEDSAKDKTKDKDTDDTDDNDDNDDTDDTDEDSDEEDGKAKGVDGARARLPRQFEPSATVQLTAR